MTNSKGKVYCSMGYSGVANWILPLGFEITKDIQEADLVAFAGGQDIDTGFYGEPRGRHTGRSGERDVIEKRDFLIALETGKKMVGVCRGAQLLCALSGGKLIQHVNSHAGNDHGLSTFDKRLFRVNSVHHQMMFPYTLPREEYKVLGWSNKPLSDVYLNGLNKEMWMPSFFKETEIVKFNKTNALAIQFHPEMMYRTNYYGATNSWLGDLFLNFYNNEL